MCSEEGIKRKKQDKNKRILSLKPIEKWKVTMKSDGDKA